jgi:hypothetical protein
VLDRHQRFGGTVASEILRTAYLVTGCPAQEESNKKFHVSGNLKTYD